MDSPGRALDNKFTERLSCTVKYDECYRPFYVKGRQLDGSFGMIFHGYRGERTHQALG